MKNLFVLFLLFFTTDSHSSGIASNSASAPCTNNTLETYSGNSNLSADWQPNEIKLRWYNGNTLMDVQSSANTCTYDDTLTIPQTAPTRTGYTFDGWTVRPEIDFAATIPTNVDGTEQFCKGMLNNLDYCWYNDLTHVSCDAYDSYKELQQQEWKIKFEHGDLYGMSRCSTNGGTSGQPGIPTQEVGTHCWCKATGYKATNASSISSPKFELPWINRSEHNSEWLCMEVCVLYCADFIKQRTVFRTALFTPVN